MNSGMNNLGAAAASCNMKDGGGMKSPANGSAMIAHTILVTSTIIHVAAGRGCATGVHAAIHVAA